VQSLSINSHIEPHNQGLMLFKDIFIYVFDITRSCWLLTAERAKEKCYIQTLWVIGHFGWALREL